MPYVNIKITRKRVTAGQKAALIAGATRLLADVLGKEPATTVVIIDEIETDNWGLGGETVTVCRRQQEMTEVVLHGAEGSQEWRQVKAFAHNTQLSLISAPNLARH